MSEHSAALEDAVTAMLARYCTDARLAETAGTLDSTLWSVLSDAGLTRIAVPESLGGDGGTLDDIAVVLRCAGEYCAAVPLAESLLGNWLLTAAGLPIPDGIMTVGTGNLLATPSNGGWDIAGALSRVAYGRGADVVAGLAGGPRGPVVFAAALERTTIRPGANLAGEPRDEIFVGSEAILAAADVGAEVGTELTARARLARALMLTGAAHSALTAAVDYAGQRRQFGRPIGTFQAVQQQMAWAAGESAAARAATDTAVLRCRGGFGLVARTSAALAKARTAMAAGIVASVAHQIHGAIGITAEHGLRHRTARLWAWREEWSSDRRCCTEVAQSLGQVGAESLWEKLVEL